MMHEAIGLAALAAALAALYVVRGRLGTFWSSVALLGALLAWLEWGFDPAIPASVYWLFTLTMLAAFGIYLTSSEQRLAEFWAPVRATIVEPRRWPILVLVLLAVPAIVAARALAASLPSSAPPARIRSVHPAPPTTINFHGPGMDAPLTVDLINDDNPLAALQRTDPERYLAAVARGKVVYYENCFYCHGDTLAADGHEASGMKPPPANLADSGVIPILQASYLFWRIAKGGPGLPAEATPFDSTMPAWETFLTDEDIWSVILYMSEFTGYRPRATEVPRGAAPRAP